MVEPNLRHENKALSDPKPGPRAAYTASLPKGVMSQLTGWHGRRLGERRLVTPRSMSFTDQVTDRPAAGAKKSCMSCWFETKFRRQEATATTARQRPARDELAARVRADSRDN